MMITPSTINDDHASWLESRGLSVEMAAKYGMKSQSGRLAIPYYRSGQLAYVKALDPLEKANTRCLPSGVEQTTLWNFDSLKEPAKQQDVLVITEGELDALACLQVGEEFVVSLPSGAVPDPTGARKKVERVLCKWEERDSDNGRTELVNVGLHPWIEPFRRVIVMTDCDTAGLVMRQAIVDVIGPEYCFIPEYPKGSKDANDVLREHGEMMLSNVINGSQPARSPCYEPITHGLKDGSPDQIKIGLDLIDRHLILSRPEFFIIGGPAGSGKSTVAQILLINLLANNLSLKASIFHGEGHRSIVTKRFMTWYRHNINANTGDEEVKAERNRWLDHRLSFIRPPQGEMPTFEWLLWAMEVHALHFKRDILLIDPWNEILHARDVRKSMTDHVGECIVKMKALADRLNLILIIVHHVTKPKERGKPPTVYDLADSAHWANKSDHALLVWRPKPDENRTRLEVAKSKDHDLLGAPGTVWCQLLQKTFALGYVEPSEEERS